MGVKGLWKILADSAEDASIEDLAGARVAVDASIWIHQFIAVKQNRPSIPGAHLVGFFRRICKLLYHNVKPIFVFDGGVPVLKQRTIRARKANRQSVQPVNFTKTAQTILDQQLERTTKKLKFDQPDLFDLPNLVSQNRYDARAVSAREMNAFVASNIPNIPAVDSKAFLALPIDTQYKLIVDLHRESRAPSQARVQGMLDEANGSALEFSKIQIKHLVGRSTLTHRAYDIAQNKVGKVAGVRDRWYTLVKNDTVGNTMVAVEKHKVEGVVKQEVTTNKRKINPGSQHFNQSKGVVNKIVGDAVNGGLSLDDILGQLQSKRPKILAEFEDDFEYSDKDDVEDSDTSIPDYFDEIPEYSDEILQIALKYSTVGYEMESQVEVYHSLEDSKELLSDTPIIDDVSASSDVHKITYANDDFAFLDQRHVDLNHLLSSDPTLNNVRLENEAIFLNNGLECLNHCISSTLIPVNDEEHKKVTLESFTEDIFRESVLFQNYSESFQEDRSYDLPNISVVHVETMQDIAPEYIGRLSQESIKTTEIDSDVNGIGASHSDCEDLTLSNVNSERVDAKIYEDDNSADPERNLESIIIEDSDGELTKVNSSVNEQQVDKPVVTDEEASSLKPSNTEIHVAELIPCIKPAVSSKSDPPSRTATHANSEITQRKITEIQTLLRLFGIPYVTAPLEAESQCAHLLITKQVDAIITEDSDVFLFGGINVFKDMFHRTRSPRVFREIVYSRAQLISLAMLLGSDYTTGVKGLGPAKSVSIINQYVDRDNGIEGLKAYHKSIQNASSGLTLPRGFPDPNVFQSYANSVVLEFKGCSWGEPITEEICGFMELTVGWDRYKTYDTLKMALTRS